ncbi:antitoxin [Arcanobacterium ihumii]|uniref:antitoxin n=1 Tax=Arcanobacterium ihumii TaxID=2138162 RepID=UPI001F388AC8|nr:antitoxin [Arcanobacterium ihumii]
MINIEGETMNFDDLKNKAVEALDGIKNDEEKTDQALDVIRDAADKLTGGKYADKLDSVRDTADEKLGSE